MVFWILAVSLALRIAVLVLVATDDPTRFFTNDSYSYHKPAEALASLGVLAPSRDQPEVAQTLRTPGYPFFLAAVYKVCGPRPTAALAVQAVLGLATLWLLFVLARRAWGERTAVLATALLALDLITFAHALMLLTETLFTLLVMAAVVVLDSWRRRDAEEVGWKWIGLAGLLFAGATLVRPISYYLLPFLALGIFILDVRRGWRRALVATGIFLLPAIVLLGGWQARNDARTGVAILSRVEGINLLFFRGAAIIALRDGIPYEEARRRLGWGSDPGLLGTSADGLRERASAHYAEEGRELIMDHPWLFLRVTARGMVQLLAAPGDGSLTRLLGMSESPDGPLGDLRRLVPADYARRWPVQRPLAFALFLVALLHLALVYVGVLSWGISCGRARRLDDGALHVLIWGIVIYLLVLSSGPEAGYRFRVPLMPFLALYAAPGLRGLFSFLAKRRARGST